MKSIPDYCFTSAYMTLDELTLGVERIGHKAFADNKTITTLTFGENVKEIGEYAFDSNEIDNINFNAVNAVSEPYGGVVLGVFGYHTVSNITIGDTKVRRRPGRAYRGLHGDLCDRLPKGVQPPHKRGHPLEDRLLRHQRTR